MENVNNQFKPEVPNSGAILALGIVSLVLIFVLSCLGFGFFGFITSIIGFVLAMGAQKKIAEAPDMYSEKSIKNVKIGKILNLIGLITGILGVVAGIVLMVMGGIAEVMQGF